MSVYFLFSLLGISLVSNSVTFVAKMLQKVLAFIEDTTGTNLICVGASCLVLDLSKSHQNTQGKIFPRHLLQEQYLK